MEKIFKGIITRTTDYKEKDKIINFFTAEGFLTAVAKGVRSSTAKLKSISSVLSYGEFSLTEGKTGFILSGGECVETFFPCWTDIKKYSAGMICLELTEKCFREEEETKEEFIQLLRCVTEISYGKNDLYIALWYSIFCAKRLGVDYSVIVETDPDTYQIIDTASADGSMSGVVGASENDFFRALKYIGICFRQTMGICLNSIRDAEKFII